MTQSAGVESYPVKLLRKPEGHTLLISFSLAAGALFLYLQLFILPATPRVASGDQALYLHNAARMYEGQLIYRDYDYFTLPGTDVLYLALFRLFGVRAWIPQMTLLLIGVSTSWLSIKIASKVMNGSAVFLPGFLFLTLPFASYLDASHHLFNVFAATCALAVVIEQRSPARLAWAGTFWGLGTCFAQSLVLGPLGLGLFLVWEAFRKPEAGILFKKLYSLCASYVVTLLAFNAYFVWKVGLKRFFYYTVTFVARYYSADETSTWRTYMVERPSFHGWVNWPDLPTWPFIHLLIPTIYLLFFVRYWRERVSHPEDKWEQLMLVNTTGLCLFFSIASAPAWNRLYTIALPALIMLVWFLNAPFRLERVLLRTLWVTVLLLAVARPVITQMRWKAVLDLPTGRTAFFDPGSYQETRWLQARSRPAEYFFGDHLLGFDLRLRNPTRVAFIRPNDFTRPEEVSNVVQGLEEHHTQFVSWYPGLDNSAGPGDHLAPLRRYLQDHYNVAETFANGNKIFQRKNLASKIAR